MIPFDNNNNGQYFNPSLSDLLFISGIVFVSIGVVLMFIGWLVNMFEKVNS